MDWVTLRKMLLGDCGCNLLLQDDVRVCFRQNNWFYDWFYRSEAKKQKLMLVEGNRS